MSHFPPRYNTKESQNVARRMHVKDEKGESTERDKREQRDNFIDRGRKQDKKKLIYITNRPGVSHFPPRQHTESRSLSRNMQVKVTYPGSGGERKMWRGTLKKHVPSSFKSAVRDFVSGGGAVLPGKNKKSSTQTLTQGRLF